jgi:hypothetical protein
LERKVSKEGRRKNRRKTAGPKGEATKTKTSRDWEE